MGEREREERVRFRFTIQFAAPRNLIKRFYVYYGQFYMCVYPRHIRFARHRPTSRPSIIHKFHPLLGFLAFPLLQIPLPLSNEPRKKEKKKNLSKEETTVFLSFSLLFFFTSVYPFRASSCLPRRFYEGATHSRAGCLRSAALRPVNAERFTRMGIYLHAAYAPVHLFAHFRHCPVVRHTVSSSSLKKYPCIHRVELLTTLARNNRAMNEISTRNRDVRRRGRRETGGGEKNSS